MLHGRYPCGMLVVERTGAPQSLAGSARACSMALRRMREDAHAEASGLGCLAARGCRSGCGQDVHLGCVGAGTRVQLVGAGAAQLGTMSCGWPAAALCAAWRIRQMESAGQRFDIRSAELVDGGGTGGTLGMACVR